MMYSGPVKMKRESGSKGGRGHDANVEVMAEKSDMKERERK